MNEETKNKESKKLNKYYILVFLLILVIGIISATYAFFQIDTTNSESKTNITANADCFEITFEDLSEDDLIKLNVNYPITDEYALGQTDSIYNLKPVVVKITNKCTQIQDNLNYKLAITTLEKNPVNDQDKGYIPDNKVRYNVKKALNKETEADSESLSNPNYLSSLSLVEDANIISLLNEEITKKGININEYNTVNTYIIDSDSLASNTYSTYYLRLWIDYYEGDSEAYTNPEGHEGRTYTCGSNQCKYDNSTEGQQFESVISLIADGTTSKELPSLIDNATKVCDMGTSMSIEVETTEDVDKYYYSTNGKDFTESTENIYSLQRINAGSKQKIYVYLKTKDGTQSKIQEYDFTTKTLGSPMTASELKASNPKDLNTNDIKTQGGMYRYQAAPADANEAAQMTNWVMFGAECTNEYAKLSEADKIDKYMYRIIGITDEGQLYLIKETFLKEGSVTGFSWNDEAKIDSGADLCPGGKCPEWNEADLFQRINGTANGTKTGTGDNDDGVDNDTDIFVDSEKYDYLRSGDNVNGGTSASEWYNLIADHSWMYGDTTTSYSSADTYNGDKVYAIETGQAETTHYIQDPEGSTTVKSQNYYWPETNKVTAKISLMYIHDYVYSYYDGETEESRGNPGNYTTANNGWLFFQKDGYNTSQSYEWLSTRWGVYSASTTVVYARFVYNDGRVGHNPLYHGYGVRPVFYLESKAKIVEGDGTKDSPFIIN